MLHLGQKVICVRDSNWPRGPYGYTPTLPQKGVVYTIRAIVPCRALFGRDEDGLHLVEIVNPTLPRKSGWVNGELAFRISRFRPVRTTSIDVFTKMLKPVPVSEPAELDHQDA